MAEALGSLWIKIPLCNDTRVRKRSKICCASCIYRCYCSDTLLGGSLKGSWGFHVFIVEINMGKFILLLILFINPRSAAILEDQQQVRTQRSCLKLLLPQIIQFLFHVNIRSTNHSTASETFTTSAALLRMKSAHVLHGSSAVREETKIHTLS